MSESVQRQPETEAFTQGQYVQVATLPPPAGGEAFGFSAAIAGNTIAIGAPGAGLNGAVYVYEMPSGGWRGDAQRPATKLTAVGPESSYQDAFGATLASWHDGVVVGEPGFIRGTGRAYVFERPAAGWASQPRLEPSARLLRPRAVPGEQFGISAAVERIADAAGDVIVVGAMAGADVGLGQAYLYRRDAQAGGWSGDVFDVAQLTIDGGTPGDHFATAVGISGELVVVGAPGSGEHGAVAVYERPAGGWSGLLKPDTMLVPSDPNARLVGESLDIAGHLVAAGSEAEEGMYQDGDIYLFFVRPGGGVQHDRARLRPAFLEYFFLGQTGVALDSGGARVIATANTPLDEGLTQVSGFVFSRGPRLSWVGNVEPSQTLPLGTESVNVAASGGVLVLAGEEQPAQVYQYQTPRA
jgi:hypothetical protein